MLRKVAGLIPIIGPLLVIYALLAASDEHDKRVAKAALDAACWEDIRCH